MKSISVGFFSVAVLLSLKSFAGPEEHIAAQTCYVLKNSSPFVSALIPERICLEEVSIEKVDGAAPAINIYSYFHRGYFDGVKLTYLARHNEDGYSFRAANVLSQAWESGCGSAEKVVLEVSGRVDNYGRGSADYVDVVVKHEALVDTCHSKPQVNTYVYIKE